MEQKEVVEIVQYVVDKAVALKNKYTGEKALEVDYVAIFAQSEEEYQNLVLAVDQMGEVLQSPNQEPLCKIKPNPNQRRGAFSAEDPSWRQIWGEAGLRGFSGGLCGVQEKVSRQASF